jgi:hypothetical protein
MEQNSIKQKEKFDYLNFELLGNWIMLAGKKIINGNFKKLHIFSTFII